MLNNQWPVHYAAGLTGPRGKAEASSNSRIVHESRATFGMLSNKSFNSEILYFFYLIIEKLSCLKYISENLNLLSLNIVFIQLK